MRIRRYWLAGLAALALAHAPASAQDSRTDIGFLTCSVTGSDRAQSGSEPGPLRQTREMLCAFRPSHSGAEETYTGTVQSVGRDQELSDRRVMIWVVKGTSATGKSPGLLQQIYAADPTATLEHAALLIGESNSEIVLQAMADSQAPPAAEKRQPIASTVIVLVTLKLKSTPT